MVDYQYLKCHSLFGGVTEDAYALISPLLQDAIFESGETVVSEGCVNDRIFFIYQGSVEILKDMETGPRRRIAVMGEGDTFGEMELIDIQPCAASVRAFERTHTLTLSNRDLYTLSKQDMTTYTLIIMNLAREISRRLRRADAMIAGFEGFPEQGD